MNLSTLRSLAACAALALSLVACRTPRGMISAGAIAPAAEAVMQRHDNYVYADTTLTRLERDAYLRTSELFRGVISAAREAAGEDSVVPVPPAEME